MSRYVLRADGEYRRSLFVEQHLTLGDVAALLFVAEYAFGVNLDGLTPNELRDRIRDVLAVRGCSAVVDAHPDDGHRALAIRAFGSPPVETTTPKGHLL